MAATTTDNDEPVVENGIQYWEAQPATYDGVLGGFGTGSLPRVETLGSRLFLLHLYPSLSTVPSAFNPSKPKFNPDTGSPEQAPRTKRVRALDVGAGIGRVTCDTLLHLVDDVVLLEPVTSFVQEALARGRASLDSSTPKRLQWRGIADKTKSVTFLQGTLQELDPLNPHRVQFLDRIGYEPSRPQDDIGMGFDVIWCQWCLGHLSNEDLIAFFRRCRTALRDREKGNSVIVVKENCCSDVDGQATIAFDEEDSSLTRSDKTWKMLFEEAGLTLVQEKLQEGLPHGLYVVKMYALR
ncbi:methyltransferase domain-containing protein [Macrolepiota fuliginosa MF-IS2]|uniref:Alpha N-terminal protein methyltransferase 1 n=1 Tax=Macrolepiota fuliginosa MF-IS2 TaxID=1400762 RepID=A0A9P6CAY7_9AGAR|nr:methyltransferase domain-containing protein [Macrolepiota fuliginosa MF-IS2]